MISQVTVREAVPDDAVELQEHIAGIVNEGLPVLFQRDSAPSVEDVRQLIEKGRSSSNSVVFVATDRPQIVGILDFHGGTRAQQKHAGSFGMSVVRDLRGHGVGTRLIEA